MSFGERIKKFRKSLNLTQQELANKLNMQPQALARYEKDKVKPSIELAKKLTDLFNINLNWLLTGRGEMFLTPHKNIVTGDIKNNNGVIIAHNSNINGDINISIQKHKKEVTQKEDELIEAYRLLPPDLQDYYYHQIKADAIKEKLKRSKK